LERKNLKAKMEKMALSTNKDFRRKCPYYPFVTRTLSYLSSPVCFHGGEAKESLIIDQWNGVDFVCSNVRFGSKADVLRPPHRYPLSRVKRRTTSKPSDMSCRYVAGGIIYC